MIPPQELKKKDFTKAMRGYEPTEVDEYVDFLIDKYTEVFSQCDEFQSKLRLVASRISEMQSEEEAIRTLSISTQKQCDKMLEEARVEADKIIKEAQDKSQAMIEAGEQKEKAIFANARQIAESTLTAISDKAEEQIRNTQEKSDALLLSARTRCAKILNDFKKEISVHRNGLLQLKQVSENYNNILLNMYKDHLNSLVTNMPEINIDLDAISESKLFDEVMQDIKNDAVDIANKTGDIEYDFQEELSILLKEIANLGDTSLSSSSGEEQENNIDNDSVSPDDSEKTTIFTKVPEVRNYEDIKVFAGQASHVGNVSTDDTLIFDKSMLNNAAVSSSSSEQEQYIEQEEQEEQYEEEPIATYDSDDYREQDDNTDYENPSEEDEYGDYDSLNNLSNNNINSDDNDDDDDEVTSKKGLFGGLFGKKKNNKNRSKSRNNDDDDSDDDDEYDIDIDDL